MSQGGWMALRARAGVAVHCGANTPASAASVMRSAEVQYRVGIDVGGAKSEGVVLDGANTALYRERVGTETAGGYPHIIERIGALYARLVARTDDAPPPPGTGTPGALSTATGRLKTSNTTALNDQPVEQDLQRQLGRAFRLENDA